MKYHNYEVKPAFLRSGDSGTVITWKITGSGTYFVGTRDGQEYMVKRYTSIRYPDPSLPKPTYDLYLEEFKAIRSKQNAIKKAFEPYDWKRDRIVIEADNFNDEENYYVVATPWITNTVPSDYSFPSMSWDAFIALAREMCLEVKKIHDVGVIHSDLKIENFCFAQEGSKVVPFLIDFDLSFMKGKAPAFDVVGGSIGYQAPELLEYIYSEDDSLGNTLLTPAIDVFSLAVTLHALYADKFPDSPGYDSAGDALCANAPISVNSIFDRPIGPNKGISFKALLEAMLNKDYKNRITMEHVVAVINDEADLSGIGGGSGPSSIDFEEPWEEDYIEYLPAEELPADHKIKSIKRAPNRHYKILKLNGIPSFVDADRLIAMGIARKKEGAPAIEDLGPHVERDDGPWPEDAAGGFSYNLENLRAKGVLSIKKQDDGGVHKYLVTYADHTSLMPGAMCKITRFITK